MKLRQVAIILGVFLLGGVVGFWGRHSVPTMFDPDAIAFAQAEKDIEEWTEFMIGEWDVSCTELEEDCEGSSVSIGKNQRIRFMIPDETIPDAVLKWVVWSTEEDQAYIIVSNQDLTSDFNVVTTTKTSENQMIWDNGLDIDQFVFTRK